MFSVSSTFAGSATWLANPGSGDWHAASNWTRGGPPNAPADTAAFDASTVSNLLVSVTTFVDGVTFNAGGQTPYTISASTLVFLGSGITNNSGTTQNFLILGEILFANNARAGSNTAFIVPEGPGFFRPEVEFFDSSTAGNATFAINGSTQGNDSSGGTVSFQDTSSAENATIIVNGSAFRHIESALDTPFPASSLFFRDSTAGNATLIANGGIGTGDGGTIIFQGVSTGGTARIKVFGNGNLNISTSVPPFDMTIGSLEGNGIVFLGGRTLNIGSNNLSTTFSGLLTDNNASGTGLPSGLTKIGTGTLTLSGVNTYTGTTTVIGGTLGVDGSIISGPITNGVIVNNGGALTGSGTTRSVTVNDGGTVVAPGDSQTLHIYGDYAQSAGGVLKIAIASADPTASGQLDVTGNAALDGTLEVRFVNGFLPLNGQVFKLFHVGGMASGSFARIIFPDLRAGFQFQSESVKGTYQITAVNDGVAATGFLNISTRMQVGTGDNALIGGFIVTPSTVSGPNGPSTGHSALSPSATSSGPSGSWPKGSGSGGATKRVILRAIGPSLAAGGAPLPGRLADPTLELRDSAGGLLFSNDNWMESAQAQEIIDSGIPPNDEHEAAIVATLAPGGYTAIMRGASDGTGVGVVEVYDLAPDVPARLANISTRGFVDTGDNVMIGGLIAGNQAMHVILRALGPSLTQSGVPNALADPTLELHDAQGAVIAFNNDWQESAERPAIESSGLAPLDERESAIVATLAPGPYTAIVRGQNDTTGVGLVEIYALH